MSGRRAWMRLFSHSSIVSSARLTTCLSSVSTSIVPSDSGKAYYWKADKWE